MSKLGLGIGLIVVADVVVLGMTVAQTPTILHSGGLTGFIAALFAVLFYGYLALMSPVAIGRLKQSILGPAVGLGVISGVMLGLDLLSGYLFPDPQLSAKTSLLAYGLTLLSILIGGYIGARRTGKLATGMKGALAVTLISLLIWFLAEFTLLFLFANTRAGAVFIGDEMKNDFLRSGTTDYQAFVLSDFYGAGFFHLLLGLIITPIIGGIGVLISRINRDII